MFKEIEQENVVGPLNMLFYSSLRKHENEKTKKWEVWLYKTNGSRDTEEYDTEEEADTRISELKDAGSYLEIEGVYYNLFWVSSMEKQKIETESKTEYRVVYNRTGLGAGSFAPYESFETEEEADTAMQTAQDQGVGGFVQKDTLEDLPVPGNPNYVYIAKDTGQTWYWDKATNTYIKTGIAGRTGVYNTEKPLATKIGGEVEINKSDLTELVKATVDFMDGSDVIGPKFVHGLIISSTDTKVKVRTVTDFAYENFKQVDDLSSLPSISKALEEEIYYVKDIKEFRLADKTNNQWVTPYQFCLDRVTALEEGLAQEVEDRTTADSELSSSIATETENRIAADTAELEARIAAVSAEATARSDADLALQSMVDTEETARMEADEEIRTDLKNKNPIYHVSGGTFVIQGKKIGTYHISGFGTQRIAIKVGNNSSEMVTESIKDKLIYVVREYEDVSELGVGESLAYYFEYSGNQIKRITLTYDNVYQPGRLCQIETENVASYVIPTDLDNYLSKTNTTSYSPSEDYHPATKKFVDDLVALEEEARIAADNEIKLDILKNITEGPVNLWELERGIYKVDESIQLNYSSQRHIVTGDYGDFLFVAKTGDTGSVPFYMLGRGVKERETINTIVIGVAQNNVYGVCDTYDLAEMLNVVHTRGVQTIIDKKTFDVLPESSVVPENDNQLVNKLYVDTEVSEITPEELTHEEIEDILNDSFDILFEYDPNHLISTGEEGVRVANENIEFNPEYFEEVDNKYLIIKGSSFKLNDIEVPTEDIYIADDNDIYFYINTPELQQLIMDNGMKLAGIEFTGHVDRGALFIGDSINKELNISWIYGEPIDSEGGSN